MAAPWEQYQQPAQPTETTQQPAPWEQYGAPQAEQPALKEGQRVGHGVWDALVNGYQGSVPGLATRNKLPDVVLDPTHATWYEKLLSGAATMGAELPLMAAGIAVGAAAGTAVGGSAGTVVGPEGTVGGGAIGLVAGGFMGFYVPSAIRQSYVNAIEKGQVTSWNDFLTNTKIMLSGLGDADVQKFALKHGAIGAIGAATGGVAGVAGKTMGFGARGIAASETAGQIGAFAVAPALLDGRAPNAEDFANSAIMVVGFKAAGKVAGRIANIYAKTGIPPEQIVADAKVDPTIKEELIRTQEKIIREYDATNAIPTDAIPDGYVRLYKAEHPTVKFDDVFDRAKLTEFAPQRITNGEYWTTDWNYADYFRETYNKGETQKASIKYMDVPESKLNTFGEKINANEYTIDANKLRGATEYADIPEAYRPIAAAEAAKEAFDPTKAGKVLDSPFADIPDTKLPHQLNLSTIDGPDGLKQLMVQMGNTYEAEITKQRGGTQTHAQTEAMANAVLNDLTGGMADKIVTGREPGTPANAVELKIRGDLLIQSTVEAGSKIKAYNEAVKAGTATDQMKLDALESIHKAAMIQAEFTGAASEVGRALEYMKRIKELRTQSDRIKELVDAYGGEPEQLLKMAGEINTPEGMAKFARDAAKATTWEKIVEAWKSGLVSGPVTHLANVLGNTTFAAMRVPVDAMASVIGMARGAAVGERLSIFEPMARVMGMLEGTKNGLRIGWEMIKTEQPQVGKAESFKHAIEGKKGEIIRLPFRALGAEDAVFKEMNRHGEAFSLATQQALKEGMNPASREFRERVINLTQNPTADMVGKIDEAGKRFTFNADLGDKGKAVQSFVRSWHLQWAVPFIRTPSNIAKELLRMTPLAPFIGEWRAAIAEGGIARDRAMAEILMGTGVMATVASYALAGNISGAGDPDPAKRRTQMSAGWQPYSIKIDNKWYNYQRLQPLGTLMGMAADMAGMWEHMNENESDKLPKMLSTAFANAITNQTFLQGITMVVNAMSDPTRFGANFAQQLASSTVPNIIGQPTAMYDPFVRETNSIREAVMARIPGLREQLLPVLDSFGEPLATKTRLGGVSPITETTISQDIVRQEVARLGVGISKAPKSIELPAMGDRQLGKIELSPEQQNLFSQKSGKMAHQILTDIIGSPSWDSIPHNAGGDLIRKQIIAKVFKQTRMMGAQAAFPAEERAAAGVMIADTIKQEMNQ